MDFEFTNMRRTDIVLISGAISNSLNKCKIRKLEGKPLLLPLHEQMRVMTVRETQLAEKSIRRIFHNKKEVETTCLAQLNKSLNSKLNNLTPEFIKNYILRGDKINVVVLFGGSYDRNILSRLGLGHIEVLNIRCYDLNFDGDFYMILEKLRGKITERIFEFNIGRIQKRGRLLNLTEAHSGVCTQKHKITYAHDPKTDVRFTKCIFNRMVKEYGYQNLVKQFQPI
ncbi:uncharacterized protein LOC132932602 [Metopolophium dirhodum]|uniref:uncharacterized protein LOC132932602 n=1 Tax=Metopolophium dirhodum TaxID=44670 RepID=UPI00299043EF|nr:uncharacterized protein LOC132932602 [Metopolophium dirhodum]